METTKTPYELLVRWDDKGKLKGAHIQWLYVTRDGEAIVTSAAGPPEPIDISKGFPLQDVLNSAQAEALAGMSQSQDKIASLSHDVRKMKTAAEGAGNLAKRLERDIQGHRGAAMASIASLGFQRDWLIAELAKAGPRSEHELKAAAIEAAKAAAKRKFTGAA